MRDIIKKILKEETEEKVNGSWVNDAYVLSNDKGRIGSGTLVPFRNGDGFYVREDGKRQYTVMGLNVHPDYRRKGYAKEIIKQMENRCIEKNIDSLYILVAPGNIAINLYKSMGYEEIPIEQKFVALRKRF
jgi:ribosomal protein S18 acetylase RimI-like enzyme